MPSFDIVSEVDSVELRNAVDQANREVGNRFDFKGSDARVELADDNTLTLFADDDFKLEQVYDVLVAKMAKRGVDLRSLSRRQIEQIGGGKAKQVVSVRSGVDKDLGKRIVKLVKDSKLKLQGSIQGDSVRVSGAKRDNLQQAIAMVTAEVKDYPLQFTNFRD